LLKACSKPICSFLVPSSTLYRFSQVTDRLVILDHPGQVRNHWWHIGPCTWLDWYPASEDRRDGLPGSNFFTESPIPSQPLPAHSPAMAPKRKFWQSQLPRPTGFKLDSNSRGTVCVQSGTSCMDSPIPSASPSTSKAPSPPPPTSTSDQLVHDLLNDGAEVNDSTHQVDNDDSPVKKASSSVSVRSPPFYLVNIKVNDSTESSKAVD
jgi:hypothetical protein